MTIHFLLGMIMLFFPQIHPRISLICLNKTSDDAYTVSA